MPAKPVLVVDDDPDIRESLCALLQGEGYATITAENGAEAVAQMQEHQPCFVILDLMMPVMDGWEVRTKMQEQHELATIPVKKRAAVSIGASYLCLGQKGARQACSRRR